MAVRAGSVEEYVAALPAEVAPLFEQVARTIREAAPDAEETLAYGIPTWTRSGRSVVHLGAWKHHLSLYPVPEMDDRLGRMLAPYLSGRSTLRLPLREPLPLDAVGQVVHLLVEQRQVPPQGG